MSQNTRCLGDRYLFATVEEQHKQDFRLVAHLPLPTLEIVLIAGEAVNEELILARVRHCSLQEGASDLHRHNGPIPDMTFDKVTILGVWCASLRAKKVSSGEVNKAEFL